MEQALLENLLQAWVDMSVFIRGNRLLGQLSFNEIMVCGLLFRQETQDGSPMTATELGQRINLLKSQVNHILTALESRGLVERVRGTADKRVVYVHLTEAGRDSYRSEHARVLEILASLHDTLGSDKIQELTTLIETATAVVHDYQRRSTSCPSKS